MMLTNQQTNDINSQELEHHTQPVQIQTQSTNITNETTNLQEISQESTYSVTDSGGDVANGTPIMQPTINPLSNESQSEITILPSPSNPPTAEIETEQDKHVNRPTFEPLLPISQAQNSEIQNQLSPQFEPSVSNQSQQGKVVTKIKLLDEVDLFKWLKYDVMHPFSEKAKNTFDQVITTLDPGMREYIYTGGRVNTLVISNSESVVRTLREIFITVFGRATVIQAKCQEIEAARGLEKGVELAKNQIMKLREDTNKIPQNQAIIAIQPTIVELKSDGFKITPPEYLTYCMLLEDPVLSLSLTSFSQFTNPHDKKTESDDSETPDFISRLCLEIATMYEGQLKECVA